MGGNAIMLLAAIMPLTYCLHRHQSGMLQEA